MSKQEQRAVSSRSGRLQNTHPVFISEVGEGTQGAMSVGTPSARRNPTQTLAEFLDAELLDGVCARSPRLRAVWAGKGAGQ